MTPLDLFRSLSLQARLAVLLGGVAAALGTWGGVTVIVLGGQP